MQISKDAELILPGKMRKSFKDTTDVAEEFSLDGFQMPSNLNFHRKATSIVPRSAKAVNASKKLGHYSSPFGDPYTH